MTIQSIIDYINELSWLVMLEIEFLESDND